MILDWRSLDNCPGFGRLFDLITGEELSAFVFYADTETGVYEEYVVDWSKSKPNDYHFKRDKDGDKLTRRVETGHKLRFEALP